MKLDVNSNGYTFIFAAVLVVLVAAMLSIAATSLKTKQDLNVEMEKKQNILMSLGMTVTREQAEELYSSIIQEEIVLLNGLAQEGDISAFDINMADEVKKGINDRLLPLYVASFEGSKAYIVPLRGKGLWGPIWGYVALEADLSTVKGATFGHKTETPGLGAEISTPIFQDQFAQKQIMEEGKFVSIEVRKGDANGAHQVNGISGGTITSVGVDDMLKDCLKGYTSYFDQKKGEQKMEEVPVLEETILQDSTVVVDDQMAIL
jgi:Na+-transporting NADH:ubiquinone oxidoreductase subunit C